MVWSNDECAFEIPNVFFPKNGGPHNSGYHWARDEVPYPVAAALTAAV